MKEIILFTSVIITSIISIIGLKIGVKNESLEEIKMSIVVFCSYNLFNILSYLQNL